MQTLNIQKIQSDFLHRYYYHVSVEIKSKLSNSQLESYNIHCHTSNPNTLTWQLNVFKKYDNGINADSFSVDILPVVSTFERYRYNPYDPLFKNFDSIHANEIIVDINENVIKRFLELIRDFTEHQFQFIASVIQNDDVHFIFSFFKDRKYLFGLIEYSNSVQFKVHLVFPLFVSAKDIDDEKSENSFYCRKYPIFLKIELKFSSQINSKVLISWSVDIPSCYYCTKCIDFKNTLEESSLPVYGLNRPIKYVVNTDNIVMLPQLVESAIMKQYYLRKDLFKEICNYVAIIEYNAIDFSFLSFIVKLKKQNMAILCCIDMKLVGTFPGTFPLISIHDLQNSYSIIVNASDINYDSLVLLGKEGNIDRKDVKEFDVSLYIKELLHRIYILIVKKAFD